MRKIHELQRRPDAPDIRRIRPTVKSRNDIPAILIGLQRPPITLKVASASQSVFQLCFLTMKCPSPL